MAVYRPGSLILSILPWDSERSKWSWPEFRTKLVVFTKGKRHEVLLPIPQVEKCYLLLFPVSHGTHITGDYDRVEILSLFRHLQSMYPNYATPVMPAGTNRATKPR